MHTLKLLTTKDEVIDEIKRRYEGVTKLSMNPHGGCFYSHKYNGVGCGIGSLFPPHLADLLDGDEDDAGNILSILHDEQNPKRARIIRLRISPNIEAHWLQGVQNAHDQAVSTELFLSYLEQLRDA